MIKKEDIVKVIKKHIVENIDDVVEKDIDITKTMNYYGGNSLDVIEVISGTMRELNIKIPRALLADVKNINELAELFYQHSEAH